MVKKHFQQEPSFRMRIHTSAKDLIGHPPEPKIAPPAPHVSDRAAVIEHHTEVEWTYFASRQEVFARMGR